MLKGNLVGPPIPSPLLSSPFSSVDEVDTEKVQQ
jgi:hypothetical protein